MVVNKKFDELFIIYQSQEITFNQRVIGSLGLRVEHIYLKVGNLKVPGIIYSTSMKSAKFIVRLDDIVSKEMTKHNNIVSLRYSFKTIDKQHEISFFVSSKVVTCDKYAIETPDLYILGLEFLNRAPDDLIDKLGHYLARIGTHQKRAESRFVLNSNSQERLGLKLMDNYLFSDGKGKKCYLTEISIFSAKVLVKASHEEFEKGQNIMLLMKSEVLKGLGEMIGEVGRVEIINKEEGLYSIIIIFDQNLIPPIYKMWVAQCIESIKVKAVLF